MAHLSTMLWHLTTIFVTIQPQIHTDERRWI